MLVVNSCLKGELKNALPPLLALTPLTVNAGVKRG